MRRLLREQDQVGAAPIALTICATRTPVPVRTLTGLTAVVQLRLRVAIGLQTLTVKSRLLTGENSVRIRGDPPFHAGVAQQRQQQFRKLPGDSPHAGIGVSPSAPSSPPLKLSERAASNRLLQVRVLPGVPFCRVSPTTRGAPLRTERSGVEIPHAAPFRPRSPMQRRRT